MAQTCAETSHSAPGRLTLLDLHTAEKCRLLDEAAGRDDDDGRVGGSGLGIGTGLPNRLAHGSDRPTVEIEVRNDRRLHSARTAPTWEWVRSATFFVARIGSIMSSLLRLQFSSIKETLCEAPKVPPSERRRKLGLLRRKQVQ